MIFIGGFWFILILCLTPYLIKITKWWFQVFLFLTGLAFFTTYVVPVIFKIAPYIISAVAILAVMFAIFIYVANEREQQRLRSPENLKKIADAHEKQRNEIIHGTPDFDEETIKILNSLGSHE